MIGCFAAAVAMAGSPGSSDEQFLTTRWNRDSAKCIVTRFVRHGPFWASRVQTLRNVTTAHDVLDGLAATRNGLAIVCDHGGKAGILVAVGNGGRRFVDRPSRLYGMEFSPDGRRLALLSEAPHAKDIDDEFSVELVPSVGQPKKIAGWFVGWSGSDAEISHDGRFVVTVGPQTAAGPHGVAPFLALRGRLRPDHLVRQVGYGLPFYNGNGGRGNFASKDFEWMLEECFEWLGPPGGGVPAVDFSNDYVLDCVYGSAGPVWWIKRGSRSTPLGVRFVGSGAEFEFAMNDAFWMGKRDALKTYDPGIYRVSPATGHVSRRSIPVALYGRHFSDWSEAVWIPPRDGK